jgi:hypothetical protein
MRLSTLFIALALICTLQMPTIAQESAAPAQLERTGNVLGRVVRGNTTIVFEAAGAGNLDLDRLRTWSDFAEKHPNIARTLAYRPSLINDPTYLKNHPDLAMFFEAHPDIKSAMADNPGNFVAGQH